MESEPRYIVIWRVGEQEFRSAPRPKAGAERRKAKIEQTGHPAKIQVYIP